MAVNLGQTYLDHYQRFLDDFDHSVSFEQGGANVQILNYPDAMDNAHVLASLGLTHYQDYLRDVVEIIVPTSEMDDVVVEGVAASLSFLLELKVTIEEVSHLRHLHRSVPAFFERCEKSALAFTPPFPFPDDFSRVRLEPSGLCGKIWMGFFISEAEVKFIEREGFDAFCTLLEDNEVDVIDLRRPSVI